MDLTLRYLQLILVVLTCAFSEASEYEIKEALSREWGRNCDGTLHFKKAHCFCFTVAIRIVIRD